MMSKLNRYLVPKTALVLAVLALILLAAHVGLGKQPKTVTGKEFSLSVLIGEHPSFPVTRYEDSKFLQKIREITGVKLNLIPVPDAGDAYRQKLNIMLNTNDIPDVIWTSSNDAIINSLAVKGVFLPYTDYLKYAPNLRKLISSNKDIQKSFVAQDGKLYIMPRITPNIISEVYIVREDIMRKENLKEPQTYDELYALLKTLKERYPEKIIFVNRNGGEHLVNRLAYSWGSGYETATYGFYLNRSKDRYQYGPLDPSFKDMVAWLKKLYDEKILDSEYALRTTRQWEEAFANGNALFTMDYIDRIRSINDMYIRNKDSARVVALQPPKGPTGKRGIIAKAPAMPNSGIVISAKVKEPAATVRFIDWIYSKQGRYMTKFGIEGETFVVNKDGSVTLTPQMRRAANPNGKDLFRDFGMIYYMDKYEFPAGLERLPASDPPEEDNRWVFSKEKMMKAKAVIPADPVLSFSDDQLKVLRSKGLAISDHFKANLDKFIMGARPFGEWEAFVEELNRLGVNEVLKVLNEAYAAYKKK